MMGLAGSSTTVYWTFVASSASSASSTISVPGTALAGDVAVIFDTSYNTSVTLPTAVTPTGWTQQNGVSSSSTASCTTV